MFRRTCSMLSVSLVLAACSGGASVAPAPVTPPPLDPVGAYDMVVTIDGMAVVATLIIEGSEEDGYTGFVDSDVGSASVRDIRVQGQSLLFFIPDAMANVRLEFTGDEFTGNMTGGMGDAPIRGMRKG